MTSGWRGGLLLAEAAFSLDLPVREFDRAGPPRPPGDRRGWRRISTWWQRRSW